MSDLKIGRLMLGICQTNCYFVYKEGTKDVIFFDPADKGPKASVQDSSRPSAQGWNS